MLMSDFSEEQEIQIAYQGHLESAMVNPDYFLLEGLFAANLFTYDYEEFRQQCLFICSSHTGFVEMAKREWKKIPESSTLQPFKKVLCFEGVLRRIRQQVANFRNPRPPAESAVYPSHAFPLFRPPNLRQRVKLYEPNFCLDSFQATKLDVRLSKGIINNATDIDRVPHWEDFGCTIDGLCLPPLMLYMFMNLGVFIPHLKYAGKKGPTPCIFNQPQVSMNYQPPHMIGLDAATVEVNKKSTVDARKASKRFHQGWLEGSPSWRQPIISVYPYRVDSCELEYPEGSAKHTSLFEANQREPNALFAIYDPEEVLSGDPYALRLEGSASVDKLYNFFLGVSADQAPQMATTSPPVGEVGVQEQLMWKLSILLQVLNGAFNNFEAIGDWASFYQFMYKRAGPSNLPSGMSLVHIKSLYDLVHHCSLLLQSITDIRFAFVGGLEDVVGMVTALANLNIGQTKREDFRKHYDDHPRVDFERMNQPRPVEVVWSREERDEGDIALGNEEIEVLLTYSDEVLPFRHLHAVAA
jgi:hypothetical protein